MSVKIILLLLALLLEKCHIVRTEIEPVQGALTPMELRRLSDDVTGTWRLEKDSLASSDNNGSPGILPEEAGLENETIISFFPDSTFTTVSNNGFYRYGKFHVTAGFISLDAGNDYNDIKLFFGMINGSRRIMRLTQSVRTMTFAEYAYPLQNYLEDPFYAKNNTWRLKPSETQTDEELREKLANYLQHNRYILKAAMNRHQAAVSWEFSPGIIKILNSGIGLEPMQGIPTAWSNAFYSPDEARKAYRLFEQYLQGKPYTGTGTGNWVKDDYRILTSLYDTIQKPI